jgi:hypothetical protein
MTPMELNAIRGSDNLLPRPSRNAESCRNLSSWVEEGIWGHRLWHRQTPWLLFLEFLNIAEAANRHGALFTTDFSKAFQSYRLHQRFALRNIVFNKDADLSRIAEWGKADSLKWDEWIKQMNDESLPPIGLDYSYLRDRFARFNDLRMTVELLRQTAIEPGANRRWSSRFLFPFGLYALYEDLNISASGASREYINFGRAGDLLYMMLSRSSLSAELAAEFSKYFATVTVQTKMVEKLIPPNGDDFSDLRSGGYLPYKQHPTYDRLAADWLAVLRLNLPSYDAFTHLVPLAALHVLIYLMETATVHLDRRAPVFVCEVIAPKMEFVRQRATRSFLDNDGLPWAAVEQSASAFMSGPQWEEKVQNAGLISEGERVEAGMNLLCDELWLKPDDVMGCGTVAELKDRVLAKLRDKHDDNWSIIHAAYGRNCGLVSRRGARNYRYAPTDSLLKTLVLANAGKRMEINEFLRLLFQSYRLVFGPVEAVGVLPEVDYDEPAFQKNRARLEERLRTMGLLNRLSDGCAYVENPLML